MLAHCWHTAYWAPAREAATWTAWARFEPFPIELQEDDSLSIHLNQGHSTHRSAGTLLGSGQKLSFGASHLFSFTGHAVFVPGTIQRISVCEASGLKGLSE